MVRHEIGRDGLELHSSLPGTGDTCECTQSLLQAVVVHI